MKGPAALPMAYALRMIALVVIPDNSNYVKRGDGDEKLKWTYALCDQLQWIQPTPKVSQMV